MTISLPGVKIELPRLDRTFTPPELPDAPSRRELPGLSERLRLPEMPRLPERLEGLALPRLPSISDALPLRRSSMRERLIDFAPAILLAVVATGVGVVSAFLLDPTMGPARRGRLRERVAGQVQRIGRRTGRVPISPDVDGTGIGGRPDGEMYDASSDAVGLAQRVETELFRDPDIDKARISITVDARTVFLRGTADTPTSIAMVERRVRRIPGVGEVVNLLHLPGTPVPNHSSGAAEIGARESSAASDDLV
jgi:hypothetical protein